MGRPPFIVTKTSGYPFEINEPWDSRYTGPPVRRWFGVLMRLIWQRVLAPEQWKPTRPLARRMNRVRKLPLDGEAIKVTHLRRYEPGWETEPSEYHGERGPLMHTVVVKGHWRDQHYPSLGPARTGSGDWNEASHRRIWIDPHFRGEGPILMKHNLTAIVR